MLRGVVAVVAAQVSHYHQAKLHGMELRLQTLKYILRVCLLEAGGGWAEPAKPPGSVGTEHWGPCELCGPCGSSPTGSKPGRKEAKKEVKKGPKPDAKKESKKDTKKATKEDKVGKISRYVPFPAGKYNHSLPSPGGSFCFE